MTHLSPHNTTHNIHTQHTYSHNTKSIFRSRSFQDILIMS